MLPSLRPFALAPGFFLLLISLLLSFPAVADLNIRANSQIGNVANNYTLSVDECDKLQSLAIQSGSEDSQQLTARDAYQDSQYSNICFFDFSLSDSSSLSPRVEVKKQDRELISYSESFKAESNAPAINIISAKISGEDGKQDLTVEFEAEDDLDVRYLEASITGLRASDLRAAGGVLAQVKDKAFVTTDKPVRIYPLSDEQNTYFATLPIKQTLSTSAIANDVLVLVDAAVVDSSDNRATDSQILLTGDNISETAEALIVSNDKIILSNPLQTAVLSGPTHDHSLR